MAQISSLLAALFVALNSGCTAETTTHAAPREFGGASGKELDAAAGEAAIPASPDPTDDAARVELSCSSYCALVQQNCLTESVKQYKSNESCLSSCAAFPLGTVNDTRGNSLGCRFHFAAAAAETPASSCAAAGPSGGGHCGTNCDAYCALMARVCPMVFDDDAGCRASCVQMIGIDETNYRYGGSGDNLQCRIYHATFGAEGFPDIHCPHASPVPLTPCSG